MEDHALGFALFAALMISPLTGAAQDVNSSAERVEDSRLTSGRVKVSPFELDSAPFTFHSADGKSETCKPSSSLNLSCSKEDEPLPPMIGGIVTQGGKRFLIACVEGDGTCIRPRYGYAIAELDGRNVQFLEWNVVTTDRKTGRKLDTAPTYFFRDRVFGRVFSVRLPDCGCM